MKLTEKLASQPTLLKYCHSVIDIWEEHEIVLERGFAEQSDDFLETMEHIATLIDHIVGTDLPMYAQDYKWMCERFKEEQLYFHRNKEYRLKTLKEAKEQVYDDPEYMTRYVHGILVSQLLWPNHAQAFYLYKTTFLNQQPQNYSHVDIGPGHGLFLALAALDKKHEKLEAWDISATSLQETKNTLEIMGISETIDVREQDLLSETDIENQYHSVICSEVLEHTENPEKGLNNIFKILSPNGRAFINVPVNSPAPDHLYLWRSTDEVYDLFEKVGFIVDTFETYPATGISLEKAKRLNLDISCVAILRKPNAKKN